MVDEKLNDTNPSKFSAAELLSDRESRSWILLGGLTLALILAYLDTLWRIKSSWDLPQYSHGYLVPAFAAVLFWLRREPWQAVSHRDRWIGVGFIGLGVLLKIAGAILIIHALDYLSIIPSMLGIVVMIGGMRALRWAGAPVLFLVFMIPLPRVVENAVLRPLQTLATKSSLFALQTLGVDAYREGNRINLDHVNLNVVDACSGLRMLTIFVALAAAIAMISTTRPWWERLVVLVTSIPIAVLVNTIRITVTGLMYNVKLEDPRWNKMLHDYANHLVHDWAGLFMMPLALGFLYLEVQALTKLFVEGSENEVISVGLVGPGGVQRRPNNS